MNEKIRQHLVDQKQRMVDMLVACVERDFKEDIAIVGLSGSFATGDFHEHSDIDFIIINKTPRGWGIAKSFIMGDIGYDFYCVTWDGRLEEQASLQSPHVASLLDMEILYCAGPEYMERLMAYRERAQEKLQQPIGEECLARAEQYLNEAKRQYAEMLLDDSLGTVRLAATFVLEEGFYALASMNNTYYRRGIKRYLEECLAFRYLPKEFEKRFTDVVMAQTVDQMRTATGEYLKELVRLYKQLEQSHVASPKPSADNLRGTYEELWSNYRHKVLDNVQANHPAATLFAAMGAQQFLDEMTRSKGTRRIDLLQHFQADQLPAFKQHFLDAMASYKEEYQQVSLEVEHYEDFEELYASFMK